MCGVLFIDEASDRYRPENKRDCGQAAIEILLQMMEDNRDDLVVLLAGDESRMDMFRSNPGMASRIARHINFSDSSGEELFAIVQIITKTMHCRLDAGGEAALHRIGPDIEVIATKETNDAYKRVEKGDVQFRYVIDMASLKLADDAA